MPASGAELPGSVRKIKRTFHSPPEGCAWTRPGELSFGRLTSGAHSDSLRHRIEIGAHRGVEADGAGMSQINAPAPPAARGRRRTSVQSRGIPGEASSSGRDSPRPWPRAPCGALPRPRHLLDRGGDRGAGARKNAFLDLVNKKPMVAVGEAQRGSDGHCRPQERCDIFILHGVFPRMRPTPGGHAVAWTEIYAKETEGERCRPCVTGRLQ